MSDSRKQANPDGNAFSIPTMSDSRKQIIINGNPVENGFPIPDMVIFNKA